MDRRDRKSRGSEIPLDETAANLQNARSRRFHPQAVTPKRTFMTKLAEFAEILTPDVPLAPLTWFRIGGPAEFMAEPGSVEQLAALVRRCREEEIPLSVLGGGSNLLVATEGVPGVVLRLRPPVFGAIRVEGSTVTAGGGAKLAQLISTAVAGGCAGLEHLVGIPGSVGGALHGNAGGHGGDIGQWAHCTTVMTRTGEIHQRDRSEMVFSYRQSSLDELAILEAEFQLEEEDPEALTRRMQKLWIQKKGSQPLSHQSTGWIFTNPGGTSAAELIEQSGLKGTRVGGAEVSDQHPNFIIAHAGATSDEVLRLIDMVRQAVAERSEVELQIEIECWP